MRSVCTLSNSKPTSIPKIIGNIVYLLFIIACLVISLMTILSKGKSEKNGISFLGFNTYVVLTGSMSPTFEAGSYIISKKIPIEDVKVNDIVTFNVKETENTMVTHRAKEIKNVNGEINIITQGDANNTQDTNPVTADRFIGKTIFYLNGVGNLIVSFQDPFFIGAVFVVIFLLLILPYVVTNKKKLNN